MDKLYLNNSNLAEIIASCFQNSRDNGSFSREERDKWLLKGKILRGLHNSLLTAAFDQEDFSQVKQANQTLVQIVQELKEVRQGLVETVRIITKLTDLAKTLEQLLNIASFV